MPPLHGIVGSPLGPGGISAVLDANAGTSAACVSFDRSMRLLQHGDLSGAYGVKSGNCDVLWEAWQREGWIKALKQAEAEIIRDLGAPICPTEVCGEVHRLRESIYLRQTPVSYIGTKSWSNWTEIPLTRDVNTERAYVEICDSVLGTTPLANLQFAYPDAAIDCYVGDQTLQSPCVERLENSCGAGEDGHRFSWDLYQVVKPTVDEASYEDLTDFLTAIKWRSFTIDTTTAYEWVGKCDCNCCTSNTAITLSLEDAQEGLVCIDDCDSSGSCVCTRRNIRINYATTFSCDGFIDPGLESAVAILAAVKSGRSAWKPCGCDNNYLEWLLSEDPTAKTEFATKLRYGPTVGGMMVMRTLDKYKERPHYNQPVHSGGLMTMRKPTSRRKYSFLRG